MAEFHDRRTGKIHIIRSSRQSEGKPVYPTGINDGFCSTSNCEKKLTKQNTKIHGGGSYPIPDGRAKGRWTPEMCDSCVDAQIDNYLDSHNS